MWFAYFRKKLITEFSILGCVFVIFVETDNFMNNKKTDYLRMFVIIAICFIVIVMCTTLYFGHDVDESVRGTFGDMFGAANALFTGLSFVGLIVTILLQRRDINAQRDEVTLQSFENTFYNLLQIHRETVNNLEKNKVSRKTSGGITVEKDISIKGRAVFIHIYGRYIDHLTADRKFNDNAYLSVYKQNWEILGHYFRGIELILITIDQLKMSDNEWDYKFRYVDILKAQLSEYETAILFYHFLSSKSAGFKKIAEKYTLFEFVNIELVTDDKNLYNISAFTKM